MQRACGVRSANDIEYEFRPACVIEFQWHASHHQREKAGYHQEVEKPLKRYKPGKPFVAFLRFDLRFPEGLGVMQIQPDGADKPSDGMNAKERKCANQQARHRQEYHVQ